MALSAKFRVLTINDVYEFESRKGLGGFAQMSTLLKQHRAESDGPCFAVLNGDFLGGSALAERFKGESVIPVLNAMDLDAVVLGNHEFDYGAEVLRKRMDESEFLWFGSNVIDSTSNKVFPHVTVTHIVDVPATPFADADGGANDARSPPYPGESLSAPEIHSPVATPLHTPLHAAPFSSPSTSSGVTGGSPSPRMPAFALPNQAAHGAAPPATRSLRDADTATTNGTTPRKKRKVSSAEQDESSSSPRGSAGSALSPREITVTPAREDDTKMNDASDHEGENGGANGTNGKANGTNGAASFDRSNTIRVGFFGVCTEKTPALSWPGPTVKFTPYLDASREAVDMLREQQCDVIIALTHISNREDIQLAQAIPGIHVVLGGHDHTPYMSVHNKALVMKCGQNARWLGLVDLDLELHPADPSIGEERYVRVIPSWNMISNYRVKPDAAVAQIVDKYKKIKEESDSHEDPNEVVTRVVDEDLLTSTAVVRCKEAAFGTLIADAMAKHYGCDLGIINGGFIRGDRRYRVGTKITVGVVRTELPFQKNALKLIIKGVHVREALEQALQLAPDMSGSFPHLSRAFQVRYSHDRAKGSRIVELNVNGAPIEPERRYSVAVTEFLAKGGDGITAWTKGKVVEDHGVKVSDLTLDFFRMYNGSGVSGKIPGRLGNVESQALKERMTKSPRMEATGPVRA